MHYLFNNTTGLGLRTSVTVGKKNSIKREKKMSLVVYNPTSGPAASNMELSPRVKNLQGGVLGVIDNGKTNSDTVLNRIVSDLSVRYHFKDVITVKKHSVSHAIKDDIAQMLAQKCDFVLAGIGD